MFSTLRRGSKGNRAGNREPVKSTGNWREKRQVYGTVSITYATKIFEVLRSGKGRINPCSREIEFQENEQIRPPASISCKRVPRFFPPSEGVSRRVYS